MGGGGYSLIGTSNTNNYTDTTVTNSVRYYYVVTALDGVGNESAWSNQTSAVPYAPIGWAGHLWPETLTITIDATQHQTVYAQVWVDGQSLKEPYTIHTDPAVKPAGYDYRDNYGPFTVPSGEFFMMGDNRDNSNDSRYWGTLNMDLVKGRAIFLYWSWDGDKNWPRWNRLLHLIQ